MEVCMIDLGKLEKDFEVDYSPEEGFKNLFIRRKVPNDLNAPLYLIFKGIPLTEAIAIAKDNGLKIQYCYDVDGNDDLELLDVCNQINKIIEGHL
mgnify:FL=1|jgi:hypothetical protein